MKSTRKKKARILIVGTVAKRFPPISHGVATLVSFGVMEAPGADKTMQTNRGDVMDNQQSFESEEKAIEFLKGPEGESARGIRLYNGKWYRWEKDDDRFHSGWLRLATKPGLGGVQITTLRVYGTTDKEIGEVREERDKARSKLANCKEHFQYMVGNYEAQIWISTELGRTVADLQGRLAADGIYHFFHGGACEHVAKKAEEWRKTLETIRDKVRGDETLDCEFYGLRVYNEIEDLIDATLKDKGQ